MFYKSDNEKVKIINDALQSSDIQVGNGQVFGVSVNQTGVVAIILWTGENSGHVLLYDAGKTRTITQIPGYFYDLKWLNADTLVLSDGKLLYLCAGQNWDLIKLCRYTKIPYGPIKIMASPDKKTISYLKWKGDNRKIVLVAIETGEQRELRYSCFSYAFMSNTVILFDYGDSIYSVDTVTEKKTTFIKATKNIISTGNPESPHIQKIKKLLMDNTCTIDSVEYPVVVENRIYFSSFICTNNDKAVSLLSVNKERGDLKLHLQLSEGVIEDVYISPDQQLACMKIRPNDLKNESISPGWYQAKENGINFIGKFLSIN